MSNLVRLDRALAAPEVERPSPDKLIAGDPVHTTWLFEDREGLYCGLWQTTPGSWRISYAEWEYIHVLSGSSTLIEDDGTEHRLAAGDALMIRPGFSGVWHCTETLLKEFVILE